MRGGEQVVDRNGGERGDRHALAVHGVERAGRVAHDGEPRRPARQPVVAVADVVRAVVAPDRRHRLGVLQEPVDDRVGQAGRERLVAARVGGRLVAARAADGHEPPVVLDRRHDAEPALGRHGGDHEDELGLRLAGASEHAGAVDDAGVDLLPLRAAVAEGLDPVRRRGPTAGCVDDEVGLEVLDRPVAGPAGPQLDARHPGAAVIGGQADDLGAVAHLDVGDGQHPTANHRLDEVPAGADHGLALVGRGEPAVSDVGDDVLGRDQVRAGRDPLGGDAGQQALEGLATAALEPVRMPGLRHAGPAADAVGQVVPLDQRDLAGVACERRRHGQAGHAGADDHDVARRWSAGTGSPAGRARSGATKGGAGCGGGRDSRVAPRQDGWTSRPARSAIAAASTSGNRP